MTTEEQVRQLADNAHLAHTEGDFARSARLLNEAIALLAEQAGGVDASCVLDGVDALAEEALR